MASTSTDRTGVKPGGRNSGEKKPPIRASEQKGGLKKLPSKDHKSYIHLRLALDSLQSMALVYYGAAKSPREREKRAREVTEAVLAAVKPMALAADYSPCPLGYFDCGGVCLANGVPCLAYLQ